MTTFQVKPVRWLTDGGLCWNVGCWFFCANEKLHVVATGGERGEADQQGGREDMSAKEAQKGINIFLLRPSAALMQKG